MNEFLIKSFMSDDRTLLNNIISLLCFCTSKLSLYEVNEIKLIINTQLLDYLHLSLKYF